MKTYEKFIQESKKLVEGNVTLPSSLRQSANAALRQAGFDGNGRFKDINDAITKAYRTLDPFGIILPAQSMDLFLGKSGTRNLNVKNLAGDDFSNSLLAFSWHIFEGQGYTDYSKKTEIVAYLS